MDGCKVGKESTCGEARLIEIGRRLTSLRRTTEYNLHTPSIREATPGWSDTEKIALHNIHCSAVVYLGIGSDSAHAPLQGTEAGTGGMSQLNMSR